MAKPKRRDPAKEQHWRAIFAQWQQSGLTGRDFCAAHRLSESSFYSWRRELARRDQEPSSVLPPEGPADAPPSRGRPTVPTFLQVQIDAADPGPAFLEVVLVHGRRLLVRPGFDADLLRQVLRVLEEPAC